jgi:hypothetical protein
LGGNSLTKEQRIEAAQKRIRELEQLIKLWSKDDVNDVNEKTLTEIIMSQKKWAKSYG